MLGAISLTSATQAVDPRLALPPLQAPGEWFDSQRSIDGGAVDYAAALDQAAVLRADAIEGEWTNLGPTNIGGRVNDVVTDADDPSIVYMAAASGGVWRGTDFGSSWERAWPDELTQSIGSLERNGATLLAGTGEANPGGGSIVYGGTGVYASADDGASWDLIGLEDSGAIGRIMAHEDGFLIAATGNLFVEGGERGLYRWAPGMATPELWFDANTINGRTGVVDIAVDPSDPDHVIIGTWDHLRTPDARYYSGEGSGLWQTFDGGVTWDKVDEVDMAHSVTNPGSADPSENGRTAVAFAPSDPSRVYAEIANTADGTHGAFYISNDGGRTFTEEAPTGSLSGTNSSYGWWFGRIYVDPTDADKVWVMGLSLTSSSNGGASFSNTSGVHSDQHSMVWDSRVPGLVYLGNDGGVYTSTTNGSSWTQAEAQGWTQHYSIDVADVGTGDQLITGLQDNGCVVNYTGGAAEWQNHGLCGDGLEAIFQPKNPTVAWSCSQYGNCSRNVLTAPDAGASFPSGPLGLSNGLTGNRWGWIADIEFEPGSSTTMYTGSQYLYRSVDAGSAWVRWTGDLSSGDPQIDPNPGYRLRGVVTSIAPGVLTTWVGTDEGRLWKLDSLVPNSETLIESDVLPDAWITSVTTSSDDEDTAYVAYSGFRGGDNAAHVYVTTDGGATFTDISGDLPNAPVNDLLVVEDSLVAATDTGVFVRDLSVSEAGWKMLGTNLPAVPVIQVDHEFGHLTAATFGHGIQRIPFGPEGLLPVLGR